MLDRRDQLARKAAAGEALTLEEVEALLGDFDIGIYGDVPSDEDSRKVALDCWEAIAELEGDDEAHFWNHGHRLAELREHRVAAEMFIRAAFLAKKTARDGTGDLGDEADWAESALYHASKQLLLAGRPLTAALVSQKIDDTETRADARSLLAEELA